MFHILEPGFLEYKPARMALFTGHLSVLGFRSETETKKLQATILRTIVFQSLVAFFFFVVLGSPSNADGARNGYGPVTPHDDLVTKSSSVVMRSKKHGAQTATILVSWYIA
jgi:hypothetical protein